LRREVCGVCRVSLVFVREITGFYTPLGYRKIFFIYFRGRCGSYAPRRET